MHAQIIGVHYLHIQFFQLPTQWQRDAQPGQQLTQGMLRIAADKAVQRNMDGLNAARLQPGQQRSIHLVKCHDRFELFRLLQCLDQQAGGEMTAADGIPDIGKQDAGLRPPGLGHAAIRVSAPPFSS